MGLKDLLGGKRANLAEMAALGLPVPPGFVITTEACRIHLARGAPPDTLEDEVVDHLVRLEAAAGRRFGDADDPLLLSVRSGAKLSMPGMMRLVRAGALRPELLALRPVPRLHGPARALRPELLALRPVPRLHGPA